MYIFSISFFFFTSLYNYLCIFFPPFTFFFYIYICILFSSFLCVLFMYIFYIYIIRPHFKRFHLITAFIIFFCCFFLMFKNFLFLFTFFTLSIVLFYFSKLYLLRDSITFSFDIVYLRFFSLLKYSGFHFISFLLLY